MSVRVHHFNSSGEAYDASQTSEGIRDGDVLAVPAERAVGILLEAWPVAISEAKGEFHALADGVEWEAIPCVEGPVKDYGASFDVAVKELDRICWEAIDR